MKAAASASLESKKMKKSKSSTSTKAPAGHGGEPDTAKPSGLSFLSNAYEESSPVLPTDEPIELESTLTADHTMQPSAALTLPVDPLTPTLNTGEGMFLNADSIAVATALFLPTQITLIPATRPPTSQMLSTSLPNTAPPHLSSSSTWSRRTAASSSVLTTSWL